MKNIFFTHNMNILSLPNLFNPSSYSTVLGFSGSTTILLFSMAEGSALAAMVGTLLGFVMTIFGIIKSRQETALNEIDKQKREIELNQLKLQYEKQQMALEKEKLEFFQFREDFANKKV